MVFRGVKFKGTNVIHVTKCSMRVLVPCFYKKRLSDDEILRIVYLFLTGYPISNMPPMFDVMEKTLRDILKDVLIQFKKYKDYVLVPSDYVPEVIEIDEIYIKMQGKKNFYG